MTSFRWDRTTVDVCLSKTEVHIATVIITPHKAKYADITIYNGENAKGEQVIFIYTAAQATKVINFDPPLFLDRGLFIDVGGDLDDCLIHYSIGKA